MHTHIICIIILLRALYYSRVYIFIIISSTLATSRTLLAVELSTVCILYLVLTCSIHAMFEMMKEPQR